jgi:hypothetical protein
MESFSIVPPGGGSRSRKSDDRFLRRCGVGVVAAGVRFHHWGLGFRLCSFRRITRASRDGTVNAFGCLPLLGHALFPSGFRLQVNPMAQKRPSEFLLTVSGIQHRVPRRTLSSHPALRYHWLESSASSICHDQVFALGSVHHAPPSAPLSSRIPVALRHVVGFPNLGLLRRLRTPRGRPP